MAESSEIQSFYSGKNVFLTGATGFVGEFVLEGLLRKCPDISCIYILIREKKGKDQAKRLGELLESPLFETLKQKDPMFTKKLALIHGDLCLPNLGLTEMDQKTLIQNIDVVLHCAATVRFDETLRRATKINIIAIRDLLDIAKKMKKLKAFVHVSTAYSNCDRKDIDETVYEPKMEPEKFMQTVEVLDDDLLKALEPRLLGDLPNTYTLTKQIAEYLVRNEAQTLPICIVRPSIVTASWEEPVPGYVDNINGATGILLGTGVGILRTIMLDKKAKSDIIPVDLVANHIIASAWHISQQRATKEEKEPEVLNCVNGANNPITWGRLTSLCYHKYFHYATMQAIWVQYTFLGKCKYKHILLHYVLHLLPAYIMDFALKCAGKPGMLVKIYTQLSKASDVISYFPMREWEFSDRNTRNVLKSMSATDRRLFNIDVKSVDWNYYVDIYIKGIRVYVVKDPLETLPQGRRRLRIMWYITYLGLIALTVGLYFLFKMFFNIIFR